MKLDEFKNEKDNFLTHIAVEKNLSIHTQKAYRSDLNQVISFWETVIQPDESNITLRHIIERYLVSLFYKKIDKSSIARKFSCFKSFEKFLVTRGTVLNLNLQRPRLDKKLPVCMSVEEIFYLLDTVKDEDLPTSNPVRDKAIFETIYATGVRCSELVNIVSSFPKFVREFADLGEQITAAVGRYVTTVKEGAFPTEAEAYGK